MRKFHLPAFAAIAAASLALPASAYDGTIDFEGEVTTNTCVINGGAASPMKVILPRVQASQFTGAVQSTAAHTRFVVALTGCTGGGNARLFFEANGLNLDYAVNALKNKDVSAQKATGIGFALFDEDRTRIQLDKSRGQQGAKSVPITSAAAQLGYEVAYVKIAPTVTAGKVLGSIEYSIDYH